MKEFYLKIIPWRLYTFRVCPGTKVSGTVGLPPVKQASTSGWAGLNLGVSRPQPRGEQSFLFHCSWKFSLYAQIHFQTKKKLSLIKCHEYTRSVLQKLDPWLVYTNSHSEYFTSVFCLQQHFQRMLITLPVYGLLVPSSFYEKECSPIFKSLSFLFL